MASIQRIGFSRSENDLSKIFKALGHPARIAIINHLLQEGRIMCKNIVNELPLSQPATSKHLHVLMETGLIGYEKISNATYFVVNPLLINHAQKGLKQITSEAVDQEVDFSNIIFNTQIETEEV